MDGIEQYIQVAPRVGAWIENQSSLYRIYPSETVAPRVGAWIEKLYVNALPKLLDMSLLA